jgi:hypothetical protein
MVDFLEARTLVLEARSAQEAALNALAQAGARSLTERRLQQGQVGTVRFTVTALQSESWAQPPCDNHHGFQCYAFCSYRKIRALDSGSHIIRNRDHNTPHSECLLL